MNFLTVSISLSLILIGSFSLFVSADENIIPVWIKNTATFWGDDKISDTEFINAMQFLIQNDIIQIESSNLDGFVEVKGELFNILYPENILKNPKIGGGYTVIDILPYFIFDKTKTDIYTEIGNLDKNQNTIFIYPMFTQSAYEEPGFYSYFRGECSAQCLTVDIKMDHEAVFTSSGNGATILSLLGYDFITDMDVDKDPFTLKKYDKVILLHNEYVTKTMFEAITSHPKVIYLYPNALYAEISANYESNTITLIKGHNFPETSITNGFGWEYENTHPYEYDTDCLEWKFYEIPNGIMLNCYPEHIIFKDAELLRQIKNF